MDDTGLTNWYSKCVYDGATGKTKPKVEWGRKHSVVLAAGELIISSGHFE